MHLFDGVLSTSSSFSCTYARPLPAPTTLFPPPYMHARTRPRLLQPAGYLFFTRYDRGSRVRSPRLSAPWAVSPAPPPAPPTQNGRTWNQLKRLLSEGLSQSRGLPSVCFGFSGPPAPRTRTRIYYHPSIHPQPQLFLPPRMHRCTRACAYRPLVLNNRERSVRQSAHPCRSFYDPALNPPRVGDAVPRDGEWNSLSMPMQTLEYSSKC